jgi:hypothetical protein
MKTIYKNVFTLIVYSEGYPLTKNWDVDDITYELDSGAMIGYTELLSTEKVPPERIKEDLMAIGNDGTFFQDTEEE